MTAVLLYVELRTSIVAKHAFLLGRMNRTRMPRSRLSMTQVAHASRLFPERSRTHHQPAPQEPCQAPIPPNPNKIQHFHLPEIPSHSGLLPHVSLFGGGHFRCRRPSSSLFRLSDAARAMTNGIFDNPLIFLEMQNFEKSRDVEPGCGYYPVMGNLENFSLA